MKRILILLAAVMVAVPSLTAADFDSDEVQAPKPPKKEQKGGAVRQELQNHFSFYGFIRNYFTYDTRESTAGTADLFYYLPKDHNYNDYGDDLNAKGSFRFLSLTTRLGVDVSGYKVGRTEFGAKVETDFYSGLTGSTGTAQLRLRQAYATVAWGDLSLGKNSEQKAYVKLTVGQAWHPMAADQPHVTSLETGAPFNPFSRTPEVVMDATLGKRWTITGAAIWQMQYASTGPSGKSADYIKYSGVPELYAGLSYKSKTGFLARAGFSFLSIKPRWSGPDSKGVTVKVSDRLNAFNPYIYVQYTKKDFEFKAKTVYSQAGDYMNLMSGYAVCDNTASDGHWEYTPNQVSSTWASISYGKKWQFMFMAGYIQNLGTTKDLTTEYFNNYYYYTSNGDKSLVSMWRIIPTVAYNIGKFTIALEYNLTSARYGDTYNVRGVAIDNIHPVTNHRIQTMFKFTF